MKLLSGFYSLSFHTKLSLLFVVTAFAAIPLTVLSVNSVRDARSRALTSLGDPYYPDPAASWTAEPRYRIETCLNTQSRGNSNYCSSRDKTGGTSISLSIARGYTTYYWVDLLVKTDNALSVQWIEYAKGQKSCGSGTTTTCSTTISWSAPTFNAQAVISGSLTNACQGAPVGCDSNEDVRYPGKTAQFKDFKPNINFDTYVKVNGKLFEIIRNQNSGTAAVFGKPTLQQPTQGATGVSNNPTFSWTKVDGASRYGVWVSESNTFSTSPYWSIDIPQSSCSTNCSKVWGSGGWVARNNAPAAPATLTAGKVYYWLVWSCLSSSCPITGLAPIQNFTVATITLGQPVIISPVNGATNVDNNPGFTWKPVPSATSYSIGLSENPDVLNFTSLYYRRLASAQCSTTCGTSWNNGTNWAAYGSVPPKPYVLTGGKTYYWFVWACSTECPLSGISQGNFRVKGDVTQVSPSLISPINATSVNDGKPTFVWGPAGGVSIQRYRLLLKKDSNVFSNGDFWNKDVSPLICYAKPNCTVPFDNAWNYVKSALDNNPTPPNPLTAGNWYWIVIACKTSTCGFADILASQVGNFKVPNLYTSASGLSESIGACKTNGKVDVIFRWTPSGSTGITSQEINLSTFDNGFAQGSYLSTAIPSATASTWTISDLVANTYHYWRIRTVVNGALIDSAKGTFQTPNCQVNSGSLDDYSRSHSKDELYSYVRALYGNMTEPRTGYNLAEVIIGTIIGESGGNDCAMNGQYLGILQYGAATWQNQDKATGKSEAKNYMDSGRDGPYPCWKTLGLDNYAWNNTFLPVNSGNDADGWNPYAQIRATANYMLYEKPYLYTEVETGRQRYGGAACHWSAYKVRYWNCYPPIPTGL